MLMSTGPFTVVVGCGELRKYHYVHNDILSYLFLCLNVIVVYKTLHMRQTEGVVDFHFHFTKDLFSTVCASML